MADEPTNGELGRRLDSIQLLLQGLVGRAEYDAHQQGIDRRFADMAGLAAELRRQHDTDVQAIYQRIEDHERDAREGRFHWQQILIPCAIALVVALIGVLGELWISGLHK